MTYRLSVTVPVLAAPSVVWDLVTDWSRQHEWVLLTKSEGRGPTGGHAVGEEVYAFTGVGRIGFMDSMVIEQWDPPHRCRVRKTGRVVRGEAQFIVAPTEGGSTLTYQADVQMPPEPLGRLLWPLAKLVTQLGFRQSLGRLAKLARGADARSETARPASQAG